MLKETISNNRGIAVLLTVTIITILVTVTLEMHRKVRSAVFSSAALRDRLTLAYMASGGVHTAMAILVKDKLETPPNLDSVQEDWANSEKVAAVVDELEFEEGSLSVKITDELSRIQINALVKYPDTQNFNADQQQLWNHFLTLLIPEEMYQENEDSRPLAIIDSVKDWLDSGDDDAITGVYGAESEYYQDLDPPYTPRNGPFRDPSELFMVKGITPELFKGIEEIPNIADLLTVQGMTENPGQGFTFEGKININTADLPVLAALLPEGGELLAQQIFDHRSQTTGATGTVFVNDLSGANWYSSVPGLGGITINNALLTTWSDFFRIESEATLHNMKLTVTAVVKREQEQESGKWRCRVLSWQAG